MRFQNNRSTILGSDGNLINIPIGKEKEEKVEKQLKRGYSNDVTLYGTITEVFRTNYNVSFGLAVQFENDALQNNYPKVIFYESANGKIRIDTLVQNFTPGTFVKVECHIQTIQDYANTEKRVPYQTIVGDAIEKVLPEYVPDKRNRVMLSGYVANIRQPRSHMGMVRLTLLTKRNYHESHVRCLVYTNDVDDFMDKVREKDFLYTIGTIETRRVTSNGRWSIFEDYAIKEIYKENRDTRKARLLYDQKKEEARRKMKQESERKELDFSKSPNTAITVEESDQ